MSGSTTSGRSGSRAGNDGGGGDVLDMLKPNKNWATLPLFNRENWSRLRFGEVVENVNERVEPSTAAEEIYVGLDDLDPGSLHIRRWGKGSDVIGTKLRFRKGDIIFGRRRAYQRKLAVAEVDGICSAHAMVARAKPKVVLPEFLPFLMMSDKFMNRAVDISVGSLSPTINWTTLKLEEFDLPPLNQQRRIAEILWAVDENLQRWLETELAAKKHRQTIISNFVATREADTVPLGECLEEVQYGSSSKAILQPAPELLPLLRIPNVIGGKIDYNDLVWLEPSDEIKKYRLVDGDVLIVRTNGNPEYVGRSAVYEDGDFEQCLFASYLIRLRPKRGVMLPGFLHEMLESEKVKKEVRKHTKSSAGNYNLNTQGIRGLRIPVPTTKVQAGLLNEVKSVNAVVSGTSLHAQSLIQLRSMLLNSIFNS